MLIDIFSAVSQSSRLAGIPQTFGKRSDQAASHAPRISWRPTRDRIMPPAVQMVPVVTGGKQVKLVSVGLRGAGCDVRLYASAQLADLTGYAKIEGMIESFLLALHDACISQAQAGGTGGNYAIENGYWDESAPEAISMSAVVYVQPIMIYVPLLDRLPAANPASTAAELPRS